MREFRTVVLADNRTESAADSGARTTELPLLSAKMAPPEVGEVVARPRLSSRVDAGTRPVTLVTAPAGWGKTVLLGSWFRERRQREQLAWLTVEPGDRRDQLWSYLAAALPATDRAVAAGSTEPLVHLAAALARLPSPVSLVVDGADHLGDPGFATDLDYLVGHADGRLRLVLAVRTADSLPLHRWRLRAAITEVSDDELAFTTTEAAEMLALHDVTLPRFLVEQLCDRTEGWAAGLRLAGILLAGHPEPARFVGEFGGDLPAVADYLTDEVVARLPAETVEAFTRAAIDEQLSGGLLDALGGGAGGAQLLADAAVRTGFTVPLASHPGAFRHRRPLRDLFRARLRHRPEPEVRELHRRAARWYTDHDQPARALRHALAGRHADAAERLFLSSWRHLLPPPAEAAGPATPPPPPEELRDRPILALAYAADQLAAHDLPAAENLLRRAGAEELGGGRQPPSGYLALLGAALRLAGAELSGESAQIRAAAARLLTLADPDAAGNVGDVGARAVARIAVGRALMPVGHLAAAAAELRAGLVDAEETGRARVETVATSRLAAVEALRGRLTAAERSARLALARPTQHPPPDRGPADRAPAHLALAVVAFHRDQPAEVEAQLALAGPVSDAAAAAFGHLTAARVRLDQGDPSGAHHLLQAGRQHAGVTGEEPFLTGLLTAADAELHTTRGDLETARGTLVGAIEAGGEPAGPLAVALARIHLRSGDPHAVAPLLAEWSERDDDSWPLPARLAAGLLDAQAARLLGDRRRSAFLLERALALATPEGYRRVFIRADPPARDLLAEHLDSGTAHWPFVSDLLARGSAAAPATGAPALGEPLTERELTVLRYLQSILSNVEIANELSVSVNTVKTHVRSIYRKLDATRRREAVRRARDLHLL
jgi:LuxR family transcriptional regulator, maltose regulon positive regulatory protein